MIIDTYGMLDMPPDQFIGQSVAILGIKGSGKSNTAAVIMEEMLAAGVPICVVDIAGEYHTLKDKYEITTIGGSITHEVEIPLTASNVRQVAEKAYLNGLSVVLDVSDMEMESRTELLRLFFGEIWRISARKRIPLVIILEECHNWIPQSGKTAVSELFISIAAEGRKRGLSLVMVGQRSARIHKDTLTQADLCFLHKVRHPADLKVYTYLIPRPTKWTRERTNRLKVGEALVLVGERVLRCQMRKRHTEHVGFTPTMEDVPNKQLSLMELLK